MVFGHRSARRRGMLMGAAIASSRSKKAASIAPQPVAPAAPTAPNQDSIRLLKELADLKESGILTDAEFDAKKKQILGL